MFLEMAMQKQQPGEVDDRNESKNGPMTFFPLYFSEIPLQIQKHMETFVLCSHKSEKKCGGF